MSYIFLVDIWDFALFQDVRLFIMLMIIIMSIIGWASGYAGIGMLGGFMTFVYAASNANLPLFRNTLYILIVVIVLLTAQRIYWLAMGEEA